MPLSVSPACRKMDVRDFPGNPVAKTSPSNARGVQVQFLVGELEFHVPLGQKTKTQKQKKYCNKLNKDFKNGLHPKKKKKKKDGCQSWQDPCMFADLVAYSAPPLPPPQPPLHLPTNLSEITKGEQNRDPQLGKIPTWAGC